MTNSIRVQRGVQHRSTTTIIRNAPVHPDVPLPHALPGDRSGGFQRRPEEERYPAGVPFHTTWTPAGTLPRGDDGRFFGSCVEACEHINASPLPRLWMCEWGECAARPLGSGRRNLRTLQRANAKAGEFLESRGGRGCPSSEDFQRVLPTVQHLQRGKFPVKQKHVRVCEWRKISFDNVVDALESRCSFISCIIFGNPSVHIRRSNCSGADLIIEYICV